MSSEKYMLLGLLTELPEDERQKILDLKNKIVEQVDELGELGVISAALAVLEIQEKHE